MDECVADISSEVTIPSCSSENSADEVGIAQSQSSFFDELYRSFEDEAVDMPISPSSIDDILKYLSDEDLNCAFDH